MTFWHSCWGWSFVLLICLLPAVGRAQQQPVSTFPGQATTAQGNSSSTIGVTNTFQKIWSATSLPNLRKGCTIQNNGSHNMYVSEGLGVSASTLTNAAIVSAGGLYHCGDGGVVLVGEIDITGTAGDAFYASQY